MLIQKKVQQINFTWNLSLAEGEASEEAKETLSDFSKGTVKVLRFYFVLILY